jgi:hypothetical protein
MAGSTLGSGGPAACTGISTRNASAQAAMTSRRSCPRRSSTATPTAAGASSNAGGALAQHLACRSCGPQLHPWRAPNTTVLCADTLAAIVLPRARLPVTRIGRWKSFRTGYSPAPFAISGLQRARPSGGLAWYASAAAHARSCRDRAPMPIVARIPSLDSWSKFIAPASSSPQPHLPEQVDRRPHHDHGYEVPPIGKRRAQGWQGDHDEREARRVLQQNHNLSQSEVRFPAGRGNRAGAPGRVASVIKGTLPAVWPGPQARHWSRSRLRRCRSRP